MERINTQSLRDALASASARYKDAAEYLCRKEMDWAGIKIGRALDCLGTAILDAGDPQSGSIKAAIDGIEASTLVACHALNTAKPRQRTVRIEALKAACLINQRVCDGIIAGIDITTASFGDRGEQAADPVAA
jgi:hypothetical protein